MEPNETHLFQFLMRHPTIVLVAEQYYPHQNKIQVQLLVDHLVYPHIELQYIGFQ